MDYSQVIRHKQLAVSFIGNLRDGIDTEANARAGAYDNADPTLRALNVKTYM